MYTSPQLSRVCEIPLESDLTLANHARNSNECADLTIHQARLHGPSPRGHLRESPEAEPTNHESKPENREPFDPNRERDHPNSEPEHPNHEPDHPKRQSEQV